MSIIETIKEKLTAAPPPARSEDIARRLTEAEAAIPALAAKHGDLSYRAAIGEVPERDATAALNELKTARDRVASLSAALGRARDIEQQEAVQARAAMHAAQVRSIRQHIAHRIRLAEKATAAIKEACDAFRAIDETNDKIVAAWPDGIKPPMGLLTFGSLKRAVEEELLRTGHGPATNGGTFPRAFPGGGASDRKHAARPDVIPAFDVKVREDGEYLVGSLTGHIAPPAFAPATPTEPVAQTEPAAPPAPQTEAGPTIDARSVPIPRRKLT